MLEATRLGVEEQRAAREQARADLQPFVESGLEAQGAVSAGSSLEGLGGSIEDILGSDLIGLLERDRSEVVRNELGRAGLTRSGAGVQELANIRPELAFSLENQLFNRNAGRFQNAQNAAAGQGAASMRSANAISQLQSNQGSNSAQLALNRGNINTAQTQGVAGGIQALIEAFRNG